MMPNLYWEGLIPSMWEKGWVDGLVHAPLEAAVQPSMEEAGMVVEAPYAQKAAAAVDERMLMLTGVGVGRSKTQVWYEPVVWRRQRSAEDEFRNKTTHQKFVMGPTERSCASGEQDAAA